MSNVRNFGATGDGVSDDTEAIQHAVIQGDGVIELPRGDYRITAPILIDTTKTGRACVRGDGVAKVVMAAPGPAFFIVGDHGGTADPNSFKPQVWQSQRLPTLLNVEIEGADPAADGVRFEGTTQGTLDGVLLRRLRHGVILAKRNRNVLITGCHVYHNTGVGVLFDHVNLHQANITGNHISYNRLGGVVIIGSEVRNLQITGNDIEYNNFRAHKTEPTPVADVLIDCSAKGSSVREGTIVSNTIQATQSPDGANVRFIGAADDDYGTAGMWTITGNLIGSQETNVDLIHARGVTLTGNFIYTGHRHNVRVIKSTSIVLSGNCLDHNHSKGTVLPVTLRFEDSAGVVVSGCVIHDHPQAALDRAKKADEGGEPWTRPAPLSFARCKRVTVTGCQVIDGYPDGIHAESCEQTNVTGCTVTETRAEPKLRKAIHLEGASNRQSDNTH